MTTKTSTVSSSSQSPLRHSCVSALKAALGSVLVGAVFASIYSVTLPSASADDSIERKASLQSWKRNLLTPIAVATLVVLPITCATAMFASTYPPRPIAFAKSMLAIATVAAICHKATRPLKGSSSDTSIVLISVVGAGVILTALGFWPKSD